RLTGRQRKLNSLMELGAQQKKKFPERNFYLFTIIFYLNQPFLSGFTVDLVFIFSFLSPFKVEASFIASYAFNKPPVVLSSLISTSVSPPGTFTFSSGFVEDFSIK